MWVLSYNINSLTLYENLLFTLINNNITIYNIIFINNKKSKKKKNKNKNKKAKTPKTIKDIEDTLKGIKYIYVCLFYINL